MPEKITVYITKEGYAELMSRLVKGEPDAIAAQHAFNFRVLSGLDCKEWGM